MARDEEQRNKHRDGKDQIEEPHSPAPPASDVSQPPGARALAVFGARPRHYRLIG